MSETVGYLLAVTIGVVCHLFVWAFAAAAALVMAAAVKVTVLWAWWVLWG